MANLLSGSKLRAGGSGEFLDLRNAQPQLPASPTTSTGYTVVTNSLLQTRYSSSLGNLDFNLGQIQSNIPNGNIILAGNGLGFVYVSSSTQSISTLTGALVVHGGIGVGGSIWTGQDINVNGVTVGQGYHGQNNIVIQGVALPEINQFPNGQSSIAIGYNTLTGLQTSYSNLALGNYALSTGTFLTNNIAIGSHSLEALGSLQFIVLANITNAVKTVPLALVAPNHNIPNGSAVIVDNVVGMTQLNGKTFYVSVIDANTLSLYVDNIFSTPLNGSTFGNYVSGGTLSVAAAHDSNTSIGNHAGELLVNGDQNFFLGNYAGSRLVTGSHNILIGQHNAENLTRGNSNVSINGDNIVDGMDNQVNIGAVFYYDGQGNLRLSGDTTVGTGTESTSSQSGSLIVTGGAGINGNLYVTGQLHQTGQYGGINVNLTGGQLYSYTFNGTSDCLQSTSSNNIYVLGQDFTIEMWVYAQGDTTGSMFGNGSVSSGNSISLTTSTFTLSQSVGNSSGSWVISNDAWNHVAVCGSNGTIYGFVNGTLSNSFTATNTSTSIQVPAGSVDQWVTVGTNTFNSTGNFFNGSLCDVRVISGAALYTSSFTAPTHASLPLIIAPTINTVLLTAQAPFIGDSGPNQLDIKVGSTVPGISTTIPPISPANAVSAWTYNPDTDSWGTGSAIKTYNATSATSVASGALTVAGGAGIGGDLYVGGRIQVGGAVSGGDLDVNNLTVENRIYLPDGAEIYSKTCGNPDENYLVYSPRVTVSDTEPVPSRIGDCWIDTKTGNEYQRVLINGTRLWIQFQSA